MIYILLYLAAILLANLIITRFGPAAALPVAFVFIGLDLTARDRLHDAWHRRGLFWKMALLIGAGSILSFVLNRNSAPIALASFVAFAAAALADTLVYHVLRERARMLRINGSNVVSAAVDSIVFPTLAFGGWLPAIVAGQFAAKVGGGFLWSLILTKWR